MADNAGAPQGTQPGGSRHPDSPWRWRGRSKGSLLLGLAVLHLFLGLLTLTFGTFLATSVGEAHLVVLKCWYPFWGAASFLASGISALAVGRLLKSSLALCLATCLVSCLCALAGLFVLCKDLFLETPFPRPGWTLYPNPMAHSQQLELALLCCTALEVLLPGPTAITAHRQAQQWAQDVGSSPPAPSAPVELTPGPPPSYEEVTRGDT